MQPTTIIVHTSAASAVLHACAAGWHPVHIDFSAWPPEQRQWVADRVVDTDRGPKLAKDPRTNPAHLDRSPGDALDVAPPTPGRLLAIVSDAIERQHAAAKAAAEAAEASRIRDAAVEAERIAGEDLALSRYLADLRILVRGDGRPLRLGDMERPIQRAIRRRFGADAISWNTPIAAMFGLDVDLAAQIEEYEAGKRAHDAAVCTILARHDSPELAIVARYRAGVLPPAELTAILRTMLQPVIDACPHASAPKRGRLSEPENADHYTADEWRALLAARAAVARLDPACEDVAVDLQIHTGAWVDAPEDPAADSDGEIRETCRVGRIAVSATIAGFRVRAHRIVTTRDA